MTVGLELPDFDLATNGGGHVRKADLGGRRTILYFYPKDETPGCTVEGQEFTALRKDFQASGVDVFGVSPDSVRSHERFVAKCELDIPLISDPDRVLIDSLGVWRQKQFMGKSYMGVERSTFLIGPDGSVQREWRKVHAPGHAAEVLQAVSGT